MKTNCIIIFVGLALCTCCALQAQVPVAVCKNATKYLGSDCSVQITADDIDGGSTNCKTRVVSKPFFTCSDAGTATDTLTVSNLVFNQTKGLQTLYSKCTATVTIIKDVKATCQDKTVNLDASGMAHITPENVSANDPADPAIDSFFVSKKDFTCMDAGPNPVILTIANKSGSLSSCSATVTVNSNSAAKCSAKRWYVNAQSGSDGNTGLSWSAAFAGLQKAIGSARSGDQIWVAGGTYKPSAYPRNATQLNGAALPVNTRYYTFQLPDGVQIYGGFAGTETYLSERQMGEHPSMLNGDQGTYQVFHVVISVNAGAESVLDGFVITGGRAVYLGNAILVDGVAVSSANGGGIAFAQSNATVRNVAIVNNNATAEGGGIAIIDASPSLTNVTVAANTSTRQGGGIYATASAFPTLTNATVANNVATNGGNGLYVYNSSSEITVNNAVFFNNGSGQDILSSSGATVKGSNNYTQQATSGYGSPAGFHKLKLNPFAKSNDPDGADNLFGTADDGLKPGGSSELNNAGNSLLNNTAIDLLGNCRVDSGIMDVGAYEK